ncbi:MAG: aminotransferase class V-fold PLP-dependent enzyme [Hornefia sp.]|nr:aminotransferase class V-fold PLP-dependent enzyme [Hornefia sp.]
MKQHMLFSPGPVNTAPNVREALMHYDICHRSREFEVLYKGLCEKTLKIFNADESYRSVVISGSGTSANESVLSSVFDEGDRALLIRNGEFGDRLKQILNQYGIEFVDCSFEWGTAVDPEKVEKAVKENPDVKLIAMVYHETSSGIINPISEIGHIAGAYNKEYFVDCVSAAGGQHVNVVENHVTYATTVGGKCLGAYPGSAIVCFKEDKVKGLNSNMGRNVYLNLFRHYEKAIRYNQTPNTPNVNIFWALDKALDNILEEGLEHLIRRYKECADIIRNGLRELGLSLLLPEELMANTVTSVFLPEDKNLEDFIINMESDGFTVYPGKEKFYEMNIFQIANMGEIYPENCRDFLKVLEKNI